MDELVLVVPRTALPGDAAWYGLTTDGLDDFEALIEREGRYRPRAAMEVDPSWKQVIPYLVLRDGEDWFLMRRTKAGADARLHDRSQHRRRRPHRSGRRRAPRRAAARMGRGGRRRFRAGVPPGRPAQRRHDRGRRGPPGRRVRRRCGRARRHDPRDRQAGGPLRIRGGGPCGRRPARDVEPIGVRGHDRWGPLWRRRRRPIIATPGPRPADPHPATRSEDRWRPRS